MWESVLSISTKQPETVMSLTNSTFCCRCGAPCSLRRALLPPLKVTPIALVLTGEEREKREEEGRRGRREGGEGRMGNEGGREERKGREMREEGGRRGKEGGEEREGGRERRESWETIQCHANQVDWFLLQGDWSAGE